MATSIKFQLFRAFYPGLGLGELIPKLALSLLQLSEALLMGLLAIGLVRAHRRIFDRTRQRNDSVFCVVKFPK